MMRAISPAIDPFAQRAAIDALEAQRAAYRTAAQHPVSESTRPSTAGSVDRARDPERAGDAAAVSYTAGVAANGAARNATPAPADDAAQQAAALDAEASAAQATINNLTAELAAWHVASLRQSAAPAAPRDPTAPTPPDRHAAGSTGQAGTGQAGTGDDLATPRGEGTQLVPPTLGGDAPTDPGAPSPPRPAPVARVAASHVYALPGRGETERPAPTVLDRRA